VSALPEWTVHSTALGLQLQPDWPRRVPYCRPVIWFIVADDLLSTAAAFAYTQLFTDVIKWTVGRPRPDWLSRCQPDVAKVQSALTSTAVAMFDRSICTSNDQSILDDGQRSFPSGHSSCERIYSLNRREAALLILCTSQTRFLV
jgi:membrane-associated phospholipid phosphatase